VHEQNCLGIYLSKNTAVAAFLTHQGDKSSLLDCFTVNTDPDQESHPGALAPLIAQRLTQKDYNLIQVYLSIDCALYAQHIFHSEFTDLKQITGTIKFDAEEIVTTDATELAVTFQVTNSDQTGSDITLFTADNRLMTNTLTDFQAVGIDPILIEPDIVCLARFLQQNINPEKELQYLLAATSQHACYIINPQSTQNAPLTRSFLLNPKQDLTAVLTRQIPITLAAQHCEHFPTSLILVDGTNTINIETLNKNTGLNITKTDIPQALNANPELIQNAASTTHLAIAAGAALAESAKDKKADFREDFAPYQGKKRIMEKALRILSVSVTILFIALGGYFQLQVIKNRNYAKQLEKRAAADYTDAMFGNKPSSRQPITSQLKHALNEARNIQKGIGSGDDDSPTTKLTFILEAINSVPKNVDLRIADISITSKAIRITGDSNSRQSTLEFFDAIKKHKKLKKSHENLSQKSNRDTFIVNLELTK
jgi:hypothetical protein